LGDGNLHINVLNSKAMEENKFWFLCESANEKLFSLVQKFSGSIAAEHGIGLLKKNYLHFSRSSLEMKFMKSIKEVFDPDNILNPGKIF